MTRALEVLLHGELVGHVAELPEGGSEFRFVEAYHEMVPRPVLGQKFEDDLQRVHRSRRGQQLPDFFANLVPEGRLREVIEDLAGIEPDGDLDLLSFVGRDLPGAVVARPAEGRFADAWDESALTSDRKDRLSDVEEGLRFSLAGVQLKLSMLLQEDKLTLPAKDQTGEWIVKFDSERYPHLPENECSMLAWAAEAEFDVPECHLHPVSEVVGFPRKLIPPGTHALAIRRYDRPAEGGRIHQEDFTQAVGLPPTKKYDVLTYEAMARLVEQFIDREAVDELVRRLAFVIATGNDDAHLKNWSLVYPDRIRAQWSPLYDQVSTIAWRDPARVLSLKLAGAKEFHQLDRSDFERFAAKAELEPERVLETVAETLARLRSAWRTIRAELPLPGEHAAALEEHWRRVPLLREAGPLD